jgi:mannose-6-phosphate isomerase-like protein (cupin superfamily)
MPDRTRRKGPLMIIRKDDAPLFERDGTRATGYASPSRGATETSVWRLELAPGTQSPVHVLDHEEVFLALSGRAQGQLGERRYELPAGDCLVVQPGERFSIANPDGEPFEAVACMPVGGRATLEDGQTLVPPWAA